MLAASGGTNHGGNAALYTGQPFIMAMTPVQTVMIAITLIAAAINLNDGETDAIEGMTHFILFATSIMLSFLGPLTAFPHPERRNFSRPCRFPRTWSPTW